MAHARLSSALFRIGETFFHMLGEYFREASVLGFVFIPLDLWKHTEITTSRVLFVVGCSGVVFLMGVAFEWTSCAVRYGKKIWEGEEAQS